MTQIIDPALEPAQAQHDTLGEPIVVEVRGLTERHYYRGTEHALNFAYYASDDEVLLEADFDPIEIAVIDMWDENDFLDELDLEPHYSHD